MGIDVKYFLVANGIIIGMIVFSIYLRHKKNQNRPFHLNMRAGTSPGSKVVVHEDARVRDLNAQFEFQGRWYDAYEVLDLPAGCSAAHAENIYRMRRNKVDEKQRDLIDRAFIELRKRA